MIGSKVFRTKLLELRLTIDYWKLVSITTASLIQRTKGTHNLYLAFNTWNKNGRGPLETPSKRVERCHANNPAVLIYGLFKSSS
jgi:hypothetical protein